MARRFGFPQVKPGFCVKAVLPTEPNLMARNPKSVYEKSQKVQSPREERASSPRPSPPEEEKEKISQTRSKLATAAPTTALSLGALLKSARDIMRKDKGLNGDLDRLPMLTWIMFLKFLDDLELQREGEAKLAAKKFKPAIEAPYRWRDWGARSDGITGDELLGFINNEETIRADGKKGAGLFRYLRTLTSSNGDDRREVIATVFRGVQNRMVSGYLLRDVIV